MSLIVRKFKKSSIGASSVTLVPSTSGDGENHPGDLPVSQIVVSTNGATPPSSFWNTVTTDGVEYRVTIEKVT